MNNHTQTIVDNIVLTLQSKINEALARRDERIAKLEARLDLLQRKE